MIPFEWNLKCNIEVSFMTLIMVLFKFLAFLYVADVSVKEKITRSSYMMPAFMHWLWASTTVYVSSHVANTTVYVSSHVAGFSYIRIFYFNDWELTFLHCFWLFCFDCFWLFRLWIFGVPRAAHMLFCFDQ